MLAGINSLHQKDWIFKENSNTIFLQSKLFLENNFNHAFFTSKTQENNPKFLNYLLATNQSSVHVLNQVHGNKVINASESNNLSIKKGDSLISDKTLQSLWIYTADCIPILIGDIKNRNVAAIHSGWRGLAKNNIKSTLNKLEEIGSNKNNLIAALGPAISLRKYFVDQKVITSIYKTIDKNKYINNDEINKKMISLGFIDLNKDNLLRIDIRKVAKAHLKNEGLKENQISINLNCTFSEEELFNSWRRDKGENRQWSFIESK